MRERADVEKVWKRPANSDEFNYPPYKGEREEGVYWACVGCIVDIHVKVGMKGCDTEEHEIHGQAHENPRNGRRLDDCGHHCIIALAIALTKVSRGRWHFLCGGWRCMLGRGAEVQFYTDFYKLKISSRKREILFK
jgi:hypothetical protein